MAAANDIHRMKALSARKLNKAIAIVLNNYITEPIKIELLKSKRADLELEV